MRRFDNKQSEKKNNLTIMKLEQAVLSNACHESELFITILLRVFPEILVKSINYIHAHTRTHAYEQSYLAFNFVSLLLSIHVHVCTDARKQNVRNPFDVEQNTL